MKLSQNVKPVSYLKTHMSEVIKNLASNQKSIVITHNGEVRAVLQDIKAYEELQESLALLKLLAQSGHHLRKGRVKPIKKAFSRIRLSIKKKSSE